MTVLTVENVNPDKFGSFEKYLIEFTDFLANKGHEHEILFSSGPIAEVSHALDRAGAVLKVMPPEDGEPRLGSWALSKPARFINPDFVHIHFYPILYLFSFLMLFSRARLFATYHMSGAPVDNGTATRVLKNIRWWLLGSAYRHIFCVSRYNREKSIDDYRCPPAVAEVVYNAVNQTKFEPIRAQRKNRPRDKTLPVKLISVAYLVPEKGIQDLIEACAVLQTRHLVFELLIVGDGWVSTSSELPGLSTRLGENPRSMENGHEGIGNDDELAKSMASMIESNETRLRWDYIAKCSMEKSNLLTRFFAVVIIIGILGNVCAR